MVVGFALGVAILRQRVVSVTFPEGGRAFQAGDGVPHPLPATMTLDDIGHLRMRVVNRDTRFHAVGVLSVAPGDSVEARPDVCVPTLPARSVAVLVR